MAELYVGTPNGVQKLGSNVPQVLNVPTQNTKSTMYPLKTLPFDFNMGGAVIYKNRIHIIGGMSGNMHYMYDGDEWREICTLPCAANGSRCFVLNNYIFLISREYDSVNANYYDYWYRFNGVKWERVNKTESFSYNITAACAYDGKIYAFSTKNPSYGYCNVYCYDENMNRKTNELPKITFNSVTDAVEYNGDLYLYISNNNYILKYSKSSTDWKVSSAPCTYAKVFSFGDEMCIIGGLNTHENSSYYTYIDGSWNTVLTLPYAVGGHNAVKLNGIIHVFGNSHNASSNKNTHLIIGNTGTVQMKLPKDAKIYGNLTPYKNCTFLADKSLLVTENGNTQFITSSINQETIYVCIDNLQEEEIASIL